ncbi:MAG: hydrogenase formation protein HypD [Candidatus Berkiellales bacterium]
MKYQTDFRDPKRVATLAKQINAITTQNWKIMEICGGQTHSIAKFGLFDLLPDKIELIHGPGCPVCVTPKTILDQATQIAALPQVIFTSFGDMLRIPGSKQDLLSVKALGGDIRIIYSPVDAVQLALDNPTKEVVLFAVGFETTAPAHAMAIKQAAALGIKNFSVLTSIVLVPPAIEFILGSPINQVQGFLAAGHVCTVMGDSPYHQISEQYQVPIVITGFEPVDILQGIYHCVQQLENNQAYVENQYTRSVRSNGNMHAQEIINEIFEVVDMPWRGIGIIAKSGLQIKNQYQAYNAAKRFAVSNLSSTNENALCISGLILQGHKKPSECPAFGKACTPDTPLGAPMVSTEGACSAYYRYLRK